MRHQRVNPFWSGLIAALVLVVVMTAVFISGVPGGPQISLPWSQTRTVRVQLANADALAPHASVEMAGVKVGEVYSVTSQGTLAVATLQIQPQYFDIHKDATVYLRPHGLFGPKYIDIVPGTPNAPAIADGGEISVGQSVQPVDLNAILQDLQAPEQQNLRTTIVELGQAAAGQGDDVNHLLAAANSLTQVLDSPLKAADQVAPNLSDMLVNNDSFNQAFAQTPLDQLVANSETTWQAFSANADHLQSLLTHANSTLTTLDDALGGQSPSNIQTALHELAATDSNGNLGNGTIYKLSNFSYLLALLSANLTGKESTSTDPAVEDVTQGIIGAIKNVASAFYYSDRCPATALTPASGGADTNHCTWSLQHFDGNQHFLHVRVNNFTPPAPGGPQVCIPVIVPGQPTICFMNPIAYQTSPGPAQYAGSQMEGFGSLFSS